MLCISWAALMEKAVLSLLSFRLQAAIKPRLMAFRAGSEVRLLPKAVEGACPFAR
jgi:hypothetical protein